MKYILTFVLTYIVSFSSAQQHTDLPVKQKGISITIGHSQLKDESIHPKVFHGLTIGSSYRHARISRNISEYNAGIRISLMNTGYEKFPSAVSIQIPAYYKYLFGLVRNHNIIWYLGPVADMRYGTGAYFNWDESHFHFGNYLSAGIGNRVSYSMGNKSFDFHLDFPVFSCIFSPEYNPQYKIDDMTFGGILTNLSSNPEFALPNKNFYIKTGLEMRYHSKRKKARSVGYNFRYHYMKAGDGNPYQDIENYISYKFIFQP